MRCPVEARENLEVLLDYCARKLDAPVAETVESHIHACPACREFCGRQSKVWSALGDWKTVPVSDDFDRRLWNRVVREDRGGWWPRLVAPLRPPVWRPLFPAAVAVLILLAAVLIRIPSGIPPENSPAGRVEVDQVERTLEDMDMLSQFEIVAVADTDTQGSI